MAVGDVFQVGPTSVSSGSWLDVQPGSGVEWVIHNVYVPAGVPVDFEYYDGTNIITFDTDSVDGSRYNQNWHATNTKRVRIQNNHGSSQFLAADGIVTK